MSTYLYKCPLHGEFEIEHSIKEKLCECPKCKQEGIDPPNKIDRLIMPCSFILVGGGWANSGYS
jgi:hypothetical protein